MSFSFSAQDCALNPIGTDQSFSHPFNTISQRVSHVSNLSNSLRFHPYTMFDTSSIASMFKTFYLPEIHLSQSPLTGLSPHTNYSIKICRPMFSSHATSQPCYYVIWWLQVKNRGMSTTTDIKLSNWWQQTSPLGQPLRGATWLVTVNNSLQQRLQVSVIAPLWENMMLFTKPEVHNLWHCRPRTIESRPQKIYWSLDMWFLRYMSRQMNT